MTEPLTPPDCDLRGLLFMPLDVLRLRDSDLSLVATGDEFKAAVLLWCASWHQVPAASLPDDDRVLARLSGLEPKAWRKAREGAMRGWVKASDGRLYHPVVAEKALETWKDRLKYRQKRDQDRERLATWREKKQGGSDGETPHETRGETRFETPKGVERTGSGGDSSVPNGTGAAAPIDPEKKAWDDATQLLTSVGLMSVGSAKSLLGKLKKDHGIKLSDLLPAIGQAIANGTQDPASYLRKAAAGVEQRRSGGGMAPQSVDEPDSIETWKRRLAALNGPERIWIESISGPRPGERGCRVPAELLEGAK